MILLQEQRFRYLTGDTVCRVFVFNQKIIVAYIKEMTMNPISTVIYRIQFWWKKKALLNCLRDEALDLSLELLLGFMRLYCAINAPFRKNIENFEARYSFKSADGRIDAGIIFSGSKMSVVRHAIDNTNVSVVFKDGLALKNFLFAPEPDIIGAILNNEVSYTGNLNYLSKFAYMAKHLKLQFIPG
jgi:hypothetical protein